jgi:hypothetical protein
MDVELFYPDKSYSLPELKVVGVSKIRENIVLSLEGHRPNGDHMSESKVSAKIKFSAKEVASWIDQLVSLSANGGAQ